MWHGLYRTAATIYNIGTICSIWKEETTTKRVVSVSLGSPKGDKTVNVSLLGEDFEISRIGTNGDMVKYAELLRQFDGNVDAIGLGGIDMYLYANNKRYTIRDAAKLASNVKKTPVVDGSGLKNTIERETINWLNREGVIDFGKSKVLVVCAVDRFGMAESIHNLAKEVVYGDIVFGLGIPLPLRSWAAITTVARMLLPIVCILPFKWMYPTGDKQDEITPKYEEYFRWADVIAGDYKFIGRYMPTPESGALAGKTIITNTLTTEDVENLKSRKVKRIATSTLEFDGRTFGTNVLEGIAVTLAGKRPEEMSPQDYLEVLSKLNWKPSFRDIG